MSLRALAELMVEVNRGGNFVVREFPGDRRKLDVGDFYADDTLLRETLGWEHRTTLRGAIEKTLNYYAHELPYYL